jgi:hypothetical protein
MDDMVSTFDVEFHTSCTRFCAGDRFGTVAYLPSSLLVQACHSVEGSRNV